MSHISEHNPPAFPTVGEQYSPIETGMTLRDYFAAKAMQAILSNSYSIKELLRTENRAGSIADDISGFAYEHADAMLEARGQ